VRSENNVFLYDRLFGTTTLVSHNAANRLQTADAASDAARISGDGRFVVFTSQATDLVAGQDGSGRFKNVFLYDRFTGNTTLVSHDVASPVTGGERRLKSIAQGGWGSEGQRGTGFG
jgi:hypothetical protein